MRLLICFLLFILLSCSHRITLHAPTRTSFMTGSEFYTTAASYKWQSRDSLALLQILNGDLPSFLLHLSPVHVSIHDSLTGKTHSATYFVTPDYLSLGTDKDWARINITPMAAQKIADTFDCFLPTRKMVDDIYKAAKVRLAPVPMYALRDSTPTMYHHHLIIEGQRQGRKGLIAGIKKDVVISGKISRDARPDRVAIYGWHLLNGKPIQPLYTGHINWWVDYSQGIRLVYKRILVDGKWMNYTEVLQNPLYKRLICDEEDCDFYRYSY